MSKDWKLLLDHLELIALGPLHLSVFAALCSCHHLGAPRMLGLPEVGFGCVVVGLGLCQGHLDSAASGLWGRFWALGKVGWFLEL